jgi:integrase
MLRKETSIQTQEKQAFDQLVKVCFSIDSHQNEKKFSVLKADFSKVSKAFQAQFLTFKDGIAKMPLSFMILSWGEIVCRDKMFGKRYLGMMCDLLVAGLITLENKKKPVTLQDLSSQDSSLFVEKIRCYKEWTIHRREDYLCLYKAFSEWLAQETFGYIPAAKDLDRIITQKRQIPFETYLDLLSRLGLREQILAKMFYLGGPRALEEVLSLKIEDVDFSQFVIHFSADVSYPPHLFGDIQQYIENRKKGYVFVGRDEEKISHTTPFRALKLAVAELKLNPDLTFKDLTKNI